MSALPVTRRRAAKSLLGWLACLLACLAAGVLPAHAQGSLTARYMISMTGVSIGEIGWQVDIGESAYTASATGKASGMLSVLVNGKGSVESSGAVVDGGPVPANFTSKIDDDEGHTELKVAFTDGVAKERVVSGPPPEPGRLPVSDAERHGVSDPLSGMLVPVVPGGDFKAAANCKRRLRIFDGRRRYDLALSFGRVDTFKAERGYKGPVLVCGVVLHPIGGYKPGSMLVKYVAGRHDMELWFAPVAGTSLIAPIRVAMPTMLGTLKIVAVQFETVAAPPAVPATAPIHAPVTSEPLPAPASSDQPAARP
ncbi:MAG TPA: DUF3108 domain-containing protein [Pseudolabrys sp.]|nr:DUF3108 domain-containing protein [Pseudolabrys sp.]